MRIYPERAAAGKRILYPGYLKPLLILILFIFAVFTTGCSDNDIISGKAPVINSITPSSAEMGDTITVEGELFGNDPYMNRLVFSPGKFSGNEYREYAMPLSASTDMLKVLVPDGAFTGNIRVEKVHPMNGGYPVSGGNVYLPTSYQPFRINLRAGDVGRALFGYDDNEFTLGTGGSREHLIIIFCNSVPMKFNNEYLDTEYSFIISLEEAFLAESNSSESGMVLSSSGIRDDYEPELMEEPGPGIFAATGFDRRKREQLEKLLSDNRGKAIPKRETFRASVGKGAAPATANFYILSNYQGSLTDPSSFSSIQADLKYEGDNTLLYLDSSTYGGAISDPELEEIGRRFDQEPGSIYTTDRQAFGQESDINGDGKVAILMSPEVNRLTPPGAGYYIGGFFMPGDLLPSFVPAGCSNGMEIFYTLVPDSAGVYGFQIPKSFSIPVIKSTLAHEFLHMIMFNQRVLKYSSGMGPYYLEDLWLEEGLAHIAESINQYWDGNVTNSNLFLSDPYDVSLIYGEDGIENRGAAFLFLRYLADRYSEGILRELVQSRKNGEGNISAATGNDFIELFSDWYAALYLSGSGISSDPRYQFATLDEHGFSEIARDSVYALDAYYGNVRSYGSRLIKVSLPEDSDKRIRIRSSDNGRMNAVIVRLQ
ncbi:MAG: hypothetical protein GF417_13555 [Candidatus Latescibacteria bacterium]|nr:hypothetical protein [bacterium]MBD3425455.1 hypothetical protein [Candidatus Latescibacterota bacterium]